MSRDPTTPDTLDGTLNMTPFAATSGPADAAPSAGLPRHPAAVP
jgi:hypothetical protein